MMAAHATPTRAASRRWHRCARAAASGTRRRGAHNQAPSRRNRAPQGGRIPGFIVAELNRLGVTDIVGQRAWTRGRLYQYQRRQRQALPPEWRDPQYLTISKAAK